MEGHYFSLTSHYAIVIIANIRRLVNIMGAKQSGETKYALHLLHEGDSIKQAAKKAGIAPSTLYRALKTKEKKVLHNATRRGRV